jgi:UDP-2-acetamido-3-amino-2,3-dideoxy-glucuronate N-acetyltransferase
MIAPAVRWGNGVTIYHPELVDLYGCEIGDGSKIGAIAEIRKQVRIGRNAKIRTFASIPEGVTADDSAFIGPHVYFANDRRPQGVNLDGSQRGAEDWTVGQTPVKRASSIGANATIVCGVTIGEHPPVGAGSVVTHDVPAYATVAGVPARVVGDTQYGETPIS